MKLLTKALLSTLVLTASLSAQATLFDRGNGMIYDSDQNLTWLQDANYAQTSGYAAGGVMTWDAANTWASSLTVGGFTDWRLASINPNDTDGCNYSNNGTDCGYNVDTSTSELAYMFYDILGNIAQFDTSGNYQSGYGLQNTSADGVDFLNLQSNFYWSGTEYALDSDYAWFFDTYGSLQGTAYNLNAFYSWAVRSGDVASQAVPEPSILALFGLGVFGIAVARRRATGK